MIQAVLFDLDDTLLSNDMDRFLPAYLQSLSRELADVIPPERLAPELMRGTQAMLANRDPEKTLQQAFAEAFYPAVGQTEQALAPRFEAFYRGRFDELRSLTSPRPEALAVIQSVISGARSAAVATNPMMPGIAVAARLRWAGVSPEVVPFALIASYERFHFAKPDPAFLSELTAQLGLAPHEAAMVGNSASDDIQPAARLGIPAFLVDGEAVDGGFAGGLRDVPAWVESLDGVPPRSVTEASALEARLRGHLAALRTLAAELDEKAWASPAADGGWSATEIVCHLRDVEREINLVRLEAVLSQVDPFLPAPDSDQWAIPRAYRQQSGIDALRALTAGRKQLVARLQTLGLDAWDRTARHAVLGPTRLRELLAIVAEHDVIHLRQLLHTVR